MYNKMKYDKLNSAFFSSVKLLWIKKIIHSNTAH